jgi:Ran GTPase-activating protein (RanGAP) involved in mRNA processing and transport
MNSKSNARQIDFQLLRPIRSWTVSSFHNENRKANHSFQKQVNRFGMLGLHPEEGNQADGGGSRTGKRTQNPLVVLLFGDSTMLARVYEFLNVVEHFIHRLCCTNLKKQLSKVPLTFRPQVNEVDPLCRHFRDSARLGRAYPFNALRGLYFQKQVSMENVDCLHEAMPSLYRLKVIKICTLESIASTSRFILSLSELGPNAKLKTLDISESLIGDEGVVQLCQVFTSGKLSALKYLLLKHNAISDVGCRKLALALTSSKCIIQLNTIDLSVNDITDDGANFWFRKLGASGNESFMQLQDLVLCNNKLSHNCVKELSLAIRSNHVKKWRTIQLSNNTLGKKSTEQLFNVLESHGNNFESMCIMNMSFCEIDDIAIQSLGRAFDKGYFTSLVHLDVSMNNITSDGLKPFMASLNKKNVPNLAYLNIGGNAIGDIGINMITSALLLGHLRNLTYLDISYNQGVSCVSNLASAILRGCCPNLQELNIIGNFPPHFQATQLFKNRVRVRAR